MYQQVKEMLEMEADFDVEKARLSAKVNELTVALDRCRTEVLEKERLIEDLTSSGAHTTVIKDKVGEICLNIEDCCLTLVANLIINA